MSRGKVCVLGAGGHAKVVIATLQACGYEVVAAYDDDPGKSGKRLLGVPVAGKVSDVSDEPGTRAVAAIGDNAARRGVVGRFAHIEWVTAVHPRAHVEPSAKVGAGTVVFAGAVVQPEAVLGAHVIVNTGATVDHDCAVGDFALVAPGANLAGNVQLGEGVLVGVGVATVPGVKIGAWSVVGAGAVVTEDLPGGVLAIGVPAKPVRKLHQP